MKIMICDDDKSCLTKTNEQIMHWAAEKNVPVTTYLYENGDTLLQDCHRENPDVILLDIMMPLLNGMDTAREIRERNTRVKIIFLTSSVEYAVESYDVKASGYLLNPLVYEKLCRLLEECEQAVKADEETITIRTTSKYLNLPVRNIECVEAKNKKVNFTLSNGTSINSLQTLSHYEKILSADKGFFKCHRSYLVYFPAVESFTGSEIHTKSGLVIPIARGLGKGFQEAYFSYMFQEV